MSNNILGSGRSTLIDFFKSKLLNPLGVETCILILLGWTSINGNVWLFWKSIIWLVKCTKHSTIYTNFYHIGYYCCSICDCFQGINVASQFVFTEFIFNQLVYHWDSRRASYKNLKITWESCIYHFCLHWFNFFYKNYIYRETCIHQPSNNREIRKFQNIINRLLSVIETWNHKRTKILNTLESGLFYTIKQSSG